MKDTEDFYHSLLKLNPYEEIGQEYYRQFGCELSIEQFGYLRRHSQEKDPIRSLHLPSAIAEQRALREMIHQDYSERGLSIERYFPAGRNIEVERLYRFINVPRHKHEFVELVFVLSGECTHVIGEEQYSNQPGDFTIIPPTIEHELHASPDCVCLTAKMLGSTFLDLFSDILMENASLAPYFYQVLNDPYFRCVMVLHCGKDAYLRDTILRIYMQQQQDKMYAETIMNGLWGIFLAYILQNYLDTVSFLVSNVVEHEEMLRVLSFIYTNYQTITLSETAKHFHVSAPYLSAKIHSLTGRTFSEHLKSYKLQRAAELLRTTDKKLDLICEQIGYLDTAQFVRSFKAAYGLTPVKYRKANRPA